MTITGRRLTLYQGQDETIRFAVSGAAGATAAAFYVAVSSGAPADLHDLDLTTSGGDVTLTDAGADLPTVHLTRGVGAKLDPDQRLGGKPAQKD